MSYVVYLEQNRVLRKAVSDVFQGHDIPGIEVQGIDSLEELIETLPHLKADCYIVGSRFRRNRDESIKDNEYLAPLAIDTIRRKYADAQIVLLSGYESAPITAAEKEVQFIDLFCGNLTNRLQALLK